MHLASSNLSINRGQKVCTKTWSQIEAIRKLKLPNIKQKTYYILIIIFKGLNIWAMGSKGATTKSYYKWTKIKVCYKRARTKIPGVSLPFLL